MANEDSAKRMEIENAGSSVFIKLVKDEISEEISADAELVVFEGNKLCAVRIWLDKVMEALPGLPVEKAVADLVASGWTLFDPPENWRRFYDGLHGMVAPAETYEEFMARRKGDPDLRPWVFYQFVSAAGPIRIVDFTADVYVNKEHGRVVGIELSLGMDVRL